jgi:hypothetical protein
LITTPYGVIAGVPTLAAGVGEHTYRDRFFADAAAAPRAKARARA